MKKNKKSRHKLIEICIVYNSQKYMHTAKFAEFARVCQNSLEQTLANFTSSDNFRMAKTMQWLHAFLNYMKKGV